MKHLVCPNCGNTETAENLFPGIFATGTAFGTTDHEMAGLYGCPKCKQFSTAPIQIIFNIEN